MPEMIKIGGLNATKREEEEKEKDKKVNNKKTAKKETKPVKKKTKTTKSKTIKEPKVDEVVKETDVAPVTKVEETEVNIEEELKKLDTLPKTTETKATVTEDSKVQLDMSAVFGPGAFAEIEGDDAAEFIKQQNLNNGPVAAQEEVNVVKEENIQNTPEIPVENTENNEGENTDTGDDISPEIMAAGNPNCYAYLSLKTTGLYKPDIISFALVTEEGKAFYAELKDIDVMKLTPNVLVNVVQRRFNLKQDDIKPGRVCVTGDEKYVRSMLINWIREEFTDKGLTMQIVSDKVVNEFGLFMEFLLLGTPLEQYAQMVSPVCIDLNSVIASTIDISRPENMSKEEFIKGYIPAYIALGVDRLAIISDETPEAYLGNALVHAQAIRGVFRRLYNLDKDEEHVDLIKKKENPNG